MTVKRTLIVIILLTLAGLALSLWAYPRLPEQVPSHWNAAGQVDDSMPRSTAVYLLPALGLGLGLLLLYLPYIDPLHGNIERFRKVYNWFVVAFTAYMLFMHGLVIAAGLDARFNMTMMLIPVVSLLIIGAGFALERTQPNWIMGVRTPWTLTSPVVWDKTHRLAGRLFKLAGLLMLLGLLLPPAAALWLIMGLLLAASLATVVYSYIAYQAEVKG